MHIIKHLEVLVPPIVRYTLQCCASLGRYVIKNEKWMLKTNRVLIILYPFLFIYFVQVIVEFNMNLTFAT
jgi:hypothetical protein